MAIALFVLGFMALTFGCVLGFAAIKFKVDSDPLVEQVDALLPQTQCGQCGYPGCRPYAEAVVAGDDINKCPPGGEPTIKKLADLMGVEAKPLNSAHPEQPEGKKVAFIREDECIGCTKCIQACPVDAIIGAAKQMHTVITDECTGCDLCVDPCPVDCIDMLDVQASTHSWDWRLQSKPASSIPIKMVS